MLAAVVRLLKKTRIRVGNEGYAQANDSYGLTTLRNVHVKVADNATLHFHFRGKSGKTHAINLRDPQLARIVRKCNVATQLGNTRAICRKCYVHPAVLESYADGTIVHDLILPNEKMPATAPETALSPAEAAVLQFLRQRLHPASRP